MRSATRRTHILLPVSSVILMAAVAVASAQAPAPAAPAAAAPAGNADTGKKLYDSYGCYQCHGYEAQGGAAGPRLASRPLPYEGFVRYVRRPTNQMPPYTERLVPDADLPHIYAYIQSRPTPPAVESIPLLR